MTGVDNLVDLVIPHFRIKVMDFDRICVAAIVFTVYVSSVAPGHSHFLSNRKKGTKPCYERSRLCINGAHRSVFVNISIFAATKSTNALTFAAGSPFG